MDQKANDHPIMGTADNKTAADQTNSKGVTKVQELMYELKVCEVMTRNVVTVSPETPMNELRDILRVNKISGTPVLESENLVGVISIEDFIKWLSAGSKDLKVKDQMIAKVEIIYADEPLVHAVNKLGTSGYGRFPVIDRETKKLVGIVTNGDLIKGLLKKMEVDWHDEEIHRYRASHIFEDIVADKALLQLQFNIEGSNMKKAGEASSGLKKALSRLGIKPPIIRRAAIASYEAEMNTIIYSHGGTMTVKVGPEAINIVFKDSGPGIPDIQKAMEPGFSTAPDWVRELGFGAGMGLTNIQKNSDHMHLESTVGKGTRLEITINSK